MLQDSLNIILTAVVTGLAGAIAGVIIYGIKKLGAWLASKTNDKTIQNIINGATSTVEMVVQEVYQTYVEGLKKDGAFDKDSQLSALNMAKDKVLEMLSTDVKDYIVKTYGDLEKWVVSKIESTIYTQKNGSTNIVLEESAS